MGVAANLPELSEWTLINAISASVMKCVVNGTNRLFPEDDNSIV